MSGLEIASLAAAVATATHCVISRFSSKWERFKKAWQESEMER